MVDTRATSERAADTASDRVRERPEVEAVAPDEAVADVGRFLGATRQGGPGAGAAPGGPGGGSGPGGAPVRRASGGYRGRDLVHLQRLAGNTAVAGLVARAARPAIRELATPPVSQEPLDREERAPEVNPAIADAIAAWQAMPAEELLLAEVERQDEAAVAGEDVAEAGQAAEAASPAAPAGAPQPGAAQAGPTSPGAGPAQPAAAAGAGAAQPAAGAQATGDQATGAVAAPAGPQAAAEPSPGSAPAATPAPTPASAPQLSPRAAGAQAPAPTPSPGSAQAASPAPGRAAPAAPQAARGPAGAQAPAPTPSPGSAQAATPAVTPATPAAPANPAPTSTTRVIQMPELVVTARPARRPGGTTAAQGPSADAPATPTGFPEKPKPKPRPKGAAGAAGTPGAAGAAGTPAPATGPRKPARASGGGGGGGGGGAPKAVPLHDPTLEKWRSATATATEGVPKGDLGDAKEGPDKLEAKGKEIDATRKGEQPDFEADAKAKQPPMPQEPEKAQYLDTAAADAAVDAIAKAGDKKLTTQTFSPIDFSTMPAAPELTASDFVPRNLTNAIKDLEAKLAGKDLKPAEREAMTKELEKRKAQVAKIEEHALDAPSQTVPSVTDPGPARLEPLDPGQADLVGDAIARVLGRVGESSEAIVKQAVTSMRGDKVPRLKDDAKTEEPTLRSELEKELNGIATAAGVTDEQLKAKIEEQKAAVQKEKEATEDKLTRVGATAATAVEERGKEEGKKIAGAGKTVAKEIAKKEAAVDGPPDTAAIERKRDEFLGRAEQVGAQALAGIRAAMETRSSDLDKAAGEHKGTAKQAADNRAAAIRRHYEAKPDEAMAKARPTVDWGKTAQGLVDTEARKLKAAAQKEADGISESVKSQITTSKESIRDWAAHQQGTERSWWDRLMDMIRDWGKQASANNEAWEKQRNAQSRDAIVADFKTLTAMREAQVTGNGEAMNKEFARLSGDQKKLAQQFFAGGMSSIEFVAQSTIARIQGRRAPELAQKLEAKAIADWNWEELGQLARGSNPKFNPLELANKVRGGVAGWGTNESQVYAGLGGARTAVERAALDKCYVATFGVSMAEDVKDDMGGHELERAKALMEGKSAEADAAALKEAVAGWGTDEEAIKTALRGKTPEELEAIKAEYKRMYGVELKADLEDDMGGAELDNAVALSEGDTDKADAAELEDAMAGAGTDEEKLKRVYERIREEEEAKARQEGLTPAELQARIRERNARVKGKYNAKYGDLDTNMTAELADIDEGAVAGAKARGSSIVKTGDIKLMEALQEGDPSKIDAAKALVEHEGVYASDDELEKIARNQHKQADLDVNLQLGAEKARMKALFESGDLSPEEYKQQSEAWDAKYKSRDQAIAEKSKANMDKLRTEYSAATGGTQSFDQLIAQETSGYSQLEIQDLVAAGGKLSDEQELYYATAGAGTDEDKIKEVLKGKTPAEIEKIRKAYAEKHPGRTLDGDILEDLSGREDLDVGHTLRYGDPDTFAQQLADAKTPEERKKLLAGMKTMLAERRDFEETGAIGSVFAMGADPMNSAAQLEQAVKRAEQYDEALANYEAKNVGKKPGEALDGEAELEAAKANFEMNYGGALEAQEQVRAQIDAYADVITQVGAAVAGLAVTIATLGAAGPVVAAVYGAAAAAAMTMALKANLKGAAYSWEEAGVDLATGVVDATVSGLTAGIGKGVMQALEKAVAAQVAKQVAKEGAETVTESVVKVWAKEAMEEVIENAVQGMPSAFVGALLDDNTWKGGDPWGNVMSATGTAAAMGAGMGVGGKALGDVGGAAYGKLKGAKGGAPDLDVDVKAGGAADAVPEPKAHAGGEAPKGVVEPPEPKPLDLPPEADPGTAATKAREGDLPPGAEGKDVTKGGTLPESAAPDPKPGEARAPKADADAEAAGPGRRTPGEEPGAPKGTKADGEPHTPLDDAELTEFPEGSVGQLPDAQARDKAANKDFFEKWHESDPSRETALLRNDVTGEYVVVQGNKGSVELGRDNPRWAEELLTPEQRAKGNWVFEAHSHPIDATTKVTPESARWPSGGGKGGDFNGVAIEARRTGKPVTEEIRYIGENGPETLKYGYDPGKEKPFFVEKPGPDGKPVRTEYSTIDEYHAEYKKQFGGEPGHGVADDFPGPRDDFDYEAPTVRPGELEAKGVGRGAPDPSAIKPPDAGAKPVVDQPATAPRKPSPDDAGKPLSKEDLATRYGMPEANVKKIEAVCAEHGVVVDIRPTTPHAEVMLREGTALPKPEKVKAKTINEVDVMIGLGKEGDLGKVGFFDPSKVEPKRPANYESLDAKTKEKIDDRIKQRKEEFADYQKDMKKLEQAGLIRVEPDGTVVNTGLIPGGGEKPFTGDHDIFDIRAKDGSALSPSDYKKARQALIEAEAGVMHGGVTGWEVDAPETFHTDAGQKSYKKMVADHSPGGKEPLVRLGEGEPKATWYEPAKPAAPASEAVARGRPDVSARFGEADAKLAGSVPAADLPSARFNRSMEALEQAGMGASGRAQIEDMLKAAKGRKELSATRLGRAVDAVDQVAAVIREQPKLLTKEGQNDMFNQLLAIRDDIKKAHASGRTVDGHPLRTSEGLDKVMADMDAAIEAAKLKQRGVDPVGDLMDLMRLRDQIATAGETLRTRGSTFKADLGEPGQFKPSKKTPGTMEAPATVRAEGPVSEPLARNLPGMGKEKGEFLPSELALLDTKPADLGKTLADKLAGYHRAHLVGPGFGGELGEGIMLAPPQVNLDLQNKGVEEFIRRANESRPGVKVKAVAEGTSIQIPLADGGAETIQVLKKVSYEIEVPGLNGRTKQTFKVVIAVSDPPNGVGKVLECTIPKGLWGTEELYKAMGKAGGRQRPPSKKAGP